MPITLVFWGRHKNIIADIAIAEFNTDIAIAEFNIAVVLLILQTVQKHEDQTYKAALFTIRQIARA